LSWREKCTKNAIPHDEDAAKVLVDAIAINTMMNAVVTRSVEDIFQRSDSVNHLQIVAHSFNCK